jgi:hypothetical protein
MEGWDSGNILDALLHGRPEAHIARTSDWLSDFVGLFASAVNPPQQVPKPSAASAQQIKRMPQVRLKSVTIPANVSSRGGGSYHEQHDDWSGMWYVVVRAVSNKSRQHSILTQKENSVIVPTLGLPYQVILNKHYMEAFIRDFHKSLSNIHVIRYAFCSYVQFGQVFHILVISIVSDDLRPEHYYKIAKTIQVNFSTLGPLTWSPFDEMRRLANPRYNHEPYSLDTFSKGVFQRVLKTGRDSDSDWTVLEIE